MTEKAQKQKERDKVQVQKALKETDPLTNRLNSLEKSVSDLFKKQKEATEA